MMVNSWKIFWNKKLNSPVFKLIFSSICIKEMLGVSPAQSKWSIRDYRWDKYWTGFYQWRTGKLREVLWNETSISTPENYLLFLSVYCNTVEPMNQYKWPLVKFWNKLFTSQLLSRKIVYLAVIPFNAGLIVCHVMMVRKDGTPMIADVLATF